MVEIFQVLKTIVTGVYPYVASSALVMSGVSYLIDNPTLVDVSWGLNHFIISSVFILKQSSPNLANFFKAPLSLLKGNNQKIAFLLLSVWFVRLSGFIFYHRIWKKHKDPRYEMLAKSNKTKETVFSLFQFQLQAVMTIFTAAPLYFIFSNPQIALGNNHYIGISLCLIGILGEALADKQLQNFKDSKDKKEITFRGGLFKKARHPNLFFDLCFWTGMAIFAYNSGNKYSLFAFCGPILLWSIMNYLTIPVTTSYMKSKRENYDLVIKSTNKFLPF